MKYYILEAYLVNKYNPRKKRNETIAKRRRKKIYSFKFCVASGL